MTDIRELISRLGISGQLSPVGVNPVERTAHGDVHYQVTIRRGEQAIDSYCSTPAGRPAPSFADALRATGRRAATVERTGSLEEWARALGMDASESERERWYDAQVAEAISMRTLLGDEGFGELARCVAEASSEAGGNGARRERDDDAAGYPARSDEMVFQEPAVVAEEERAQSPRLLATAAAATTTGGLVGAAIGTAAGRVVRRLPAARSAAAGGVLGLAAGALMAAAFVRRARRDAARDTAAMLADQRSAIDTGRD